METFSALLALCAGNSQVTGEFPSQRPVTRSYDVFFDLRLKKRLCKQSGLRWFETPLLIMTSLQCGIRQAVIHFFNTTLTSTYCSTNHDGNIAIDVVTIAIHQGLCEISHFHFCYLSTIIAYVYWGGY